MALKSNIFVKNNVGLQYLGNLETYWFILGKFVYKVVSLILIKYLNGLKFYKPIF